MKIRLGELRQVIREAAKETTIEKSFRELESMITKASSNVDEGLLRNALQVILKNSVDFSDKGGYGIDGKDIFYFEDAYRHFTGGRVLLGDELLTAIKAKILRAQKNDDVDTEIEDAKLVARQIEKLSIGLSKFSDIEEEAPTDAPLGRFAFPLRRRGVPPEPDTAEEKKLFQALDAHFNDDLKLNKKAVAQIEDFLVQGLYPQVFSPPAQDEVFRGMGVTKKWLANALGMNMKEIPRKGSQEVEMTYTPKVGGASSWTISKVVSNKFSDRTDRYDRVNVTLHARISDNPDKFISGPDHLYKLDYIAQFANEKEVIGLGNIKVYKISWNDETDT